VTKFGMRLMKRLPNQDMSFREHYPNTLLVRACRHRPLVQVSSLSSFELTRVSILAASPFSQRISLPQASGLSSFVRCCALLHRRNVREAATRRRTALRVSRKPSGYVNLLCHAGA
jgi:hypothetical protein